MHLLVKLYAWNQRLHMMGINFVLSKSLLSTSTKMSLLESHTNVYTIAYKSFFLDFNQVIAIQKPRTSLWSTLHNKLFRKLF